MEAELAWDTAWPVPVKAGGTAGAGTSRDGVRREGKQGASLASLPMGWMSSSSCVPHSCGVNWLLLVLCTRHLWRRCCSLRQGALGLLARIKQRGFRVHSPVGDLQPRSGVRFTHSFFWTMPSPSAPAALSHQFLFKQARFYKSQGAAPGTRDQFL